MEGAAVADRTVLLGGGKRAATIPAGDDAADSPDAELAWAVGPGAGRGVVRGGVDAAVCELTGAIPDETTILNFRHLLEQYELATDILSRINGHLSRKGLMLKRGSMVDATIIAAPSSTKNQQQQRDPEMHQTQKGNHWYFGMKAHIGVDVDSGLVHTVVTTAANEADIEVVEELLHGKEEVVYADAGYTGADKRVVRKKYRSPLVLGANSIIRGAEVAWRCANGGGRFSIRVRVSVAAVK